MKWIPSKLPIIIPIILVLALFSCSFKQNAVDFINSGKTTLHYKLGAPDDITYPDDFVKVETETGYRYVNTSETLIYGFGIGEDNQEICTYIYVSKYDEFDPGKLFDIRIGESVRVEKNETLGTEKRSLFDFLEENGFEENRDIEYMESYVEYIDGIRCHWQCYQKNNVELNVLVDQTGNSELRAFEIILKV